MTFARGLLHSTLVVLTRQVRFTPCWVRPTTPWVTRFAAFYQLAIACDSCVTPVSIENAGRDTSAGLLRVILEA